MSEQSSLQAYLHTLPEVQTAHLPPGTVFTANSLIYVVIAAGAGRFGKARQWRKGEETDVALVPNSYLTNFLPLVARARLLPIFPSRHDMLDRGEPTIYLFATEQTALDAAYLDTALVQSGDAYVRNHGREPAFAVTDGVNILRLYYYSRSSSGRSAMDAGSMAKTLQFKLFTRGPMYWRLLPSWSRGPEWSDDETLPSVKPIRPT